MTTSNASKFVQPYLFFGGRCEEALEFYRTTLGAEVDMIMRFKDCPVPVSPENVAPGTENNIMHSSFRLGGSTIMASDGNCHTKASFAGFSLSLTLPDAAEANRVFTALSEGGAVQMPLEKTFWSPLFGMVTDRFGVGWMITLPA